MDPETAQHKFTQAKHKFLEGFYEEALLLLNELIKRHPGVFNLEFPKLQCLKHLERLEETKEFHAIMTMTYTQPDHQEKLQMVGAWIAEQEAAAIDGLGGLQLNYDMDGIGGGAMDDLLGLSAPRRKTEPKPAVVAEGPAPHHRAIISIAVVVVIAVVAVIFLPGLLRPVPPFSAGIVVGLPYDTLEGKFYRKTNSVTRIEFMGQIVITNEKEVYVLIPAERKYSVMSVSEVMGNQFLSEIDDFDDWIAARNGKKIGEETLYGMNCHVYQGRLSLNPASPPSETKVWWSPDLQFLVKSETVSTGLLGQMKMFLKDLHVGPLSEELFQVPADYRQVSPKETQSLGASMGIGLGPGMGDSLSRGSASPPAYPKVPSGPPPAYTPPPAYAPPPAPDMNYTPPTNQQVDQQQMQQYIEQLKNSRQNQ